MDSWDDKFKEHDKEKVCLKDSNLIKEMNDLGDTIDSLKKHFPMKATKLKIVKEQCVGKCPLCNNLIPTSFKYCSNCGQKLEWI